MAISSELVQVLIQTIKDAGNFSLNRYEELTYRDYPFKASSQFIKSMVEIHYDLLKKLDELEQTQCNTPQELDKKWIKARRFCELFNRLHWLLEILEMGGREYVPTFIAQLIEERTKLLNPKAELIFLPDYRFNFFYKELITPLKATLKYAIPDVDTKLSFAEKMPIFWFPLAHRDNLLLNSLIGHEFGHFVNEEKSIVGLLIPKIVLDSTAVNQIVTERLKTNITAEKKEIKMDEYFRAETIELSTKTEAYTKIQAQLKELISDAVGFHIFGPAFLIAQFNYLASSATLESKPEGYPSVRTRLAFLMGLYEYMGYPGKIKQKRAVLDNKHKKIAEQYEEFVSNLKRMIDESSEASQDAEETLVDKSVDAVKKELWVEVGKALNGQGYTAEQFCNDVFKLMDAIDCIVPPVEIDFEKPANRISIINSGVLYALISIENFHKSFEDKSVKDRLSTRNKLHKLMMKAGELSIIQEKLQAKRGVPKNDQ
jgi:hypothetical protein